MYSRSQHRPSRPVQIPEHYSGCAFSPSSEEVASPTPIEAAVTQESSVAAISAVPPPPPSPPCDPPTAPPLFHGLFGGRGATLPFSRGLQFDELLILGLILLLTQSEGDSDLILLLALLLFCGS